MKELENNSETRYGRPPGKRKTAKIEILLEPEIKIEFMSICQEEGRTASMQLYQYIREFIKTYKKEEIQ